MTGFLLSNKKNECFGCSACKQACPKNAIRMKKDTEGFLYPEIRKDLCIDCKKCHAVCAAENMPIKNQPWQAFAGYSIESEKRRSSASGGAFYAITKAAVTDAVVFGVEWSSRSLAKHAKATADTAYERFHKSKYIQSEMGTAYIEAKEELSKGKFVIFTGTPCQIAGLKTFLGKEYDNLLCVDLVCHGVPSGDVLEHYFVDNESKSKSIEGIDFRYKKCQNGKWESKYAVLHYNTGKKKIVDYDSSGFLRGFACGLFFRPSCSTCPFACQERVSDLTIGDAWGIEKSKPLLNPHQGVSLILVNTEKGKIWADRMAQSMELTEVDLQIAVGGNARLKEPDKGHGSRDDFFRNIENESFERLVEHYIPRTPFVKKVGHSLKNKLLGKR